MGSRCRAGALLGTQQEAMRRQESNDESIRNCSFNCRHGHGTTEPTGIARPSSRVRPSFWISDPRRSELVPAQPTPWPSRPPNIPSRSAMTTNKPQARPIPERDLLRPEAHRVPATTSVPVPSTAGPVLDCDGSPVPARVGCPCRGGDWGRCTRRRRGRRPNRPPAWADVPAQQRYGHDARRLLKTLWGLSDRGTRHA